MRFKKKTRESKQVSGPRLRSSVSRPRSFKTGGQLTTGFEGRGAGDIVEAQGEILQLTANSRKYISKHSLTYVFHDIMFNQFRTDLLS